MVTATVAQAAPSRTYQLEDASARVRRLPGDVDWIASLASPLSRPPEFASWLSSIRDLILAERLRDALLAFDKGFAELTEELRSKPSTFILVSEAMHEAGAPAAECGDMLFNVLETKVCCRLSHLLTCQLTLTSPSQR